VTESGLALIAGPILGAVALAAPLGVHLAQVWTGGPTVLYPILAPLERTLYRAFRIDPTRRQDWTRYAIGLLALNGVAFVCLYAWLRLQGGAGRGRWLPHGLTRMKLVRARFSETLRRAGGP
jgi:K+-transporting ATPase A subunit